MGILSDIKDRLNQEDSTGEESGLEKDPSDTRLFFATDIHGSTVCWRKFVNAEEFYDADVLILGGDTTGKAIAPIVEEDGGYRYDRAGEQQFAEEDELDDVKSTLANSGFYPYVMSQDEYEDLQASEDAEARQDEIFEAEMKRRIREWIEFAEERVSTDTPIYVSPGNDDPFSIDPVWEESDRISLVEGKVVEIDGLYEMVSTGWTNRSPWDTPREEDEEDLKERLDSIISKVDDTNRAIFNFHDPPHDSQLDEAPELDDELRPKYGGRSMEPVGSTAVREMIETYQPPLSLHGHIHESRGKTRIGDTVAINPGSVYSEGSLMGAVIDLKPEVDVVGLVRG